MKARAIQDTKHNDASSFDDERGKLFCELLDKRRALDTVEKRWHEDQGTTKNTYERGLSIQKHKADISELMDELKMEIVK